MGEGEGWGGCEWCGGAKGVREMRRGGGTLAVLGNQKKNKKAEARAKREHKRD